MKKARHLADVCQDIVRVIGLFHGRPACRQITPAPVQGGRFYALGQDNDLPAWDAGRLAIGMSFEEFFKTHKRILIRKTFQDSWTQIHSVQELELFCADKPEWSWEDGYSWLYELYAVRNTAGRKAIKRLLKGEGK